MAQVGDIRQTFGAVLRCEGITPGIPLGRVMQEVYKHFGGQGDPGITITSASGDLTFQLVLVGLGDDPRSVRS